MGQQLAKFSRWHKENSFESSESANADDSWRAQIAAAVSPIRSLLELGERMTVPVLTLWVIVNLKAVHGNEVISAERAGCVERTGWGGVEC